MGQYYIIANVDKRQYLTPHAFGDGAKLMEFANGQGTIMTALAILLADGNGRGGGDFWMKEPSEQLGDRTGPDESQNPLAALVGSWAGDRIVIAGDYADGERFLDGVTNEELLTIARSSFTEGYQTPDRVNLYHYAGEKYEDISDKVIQLIQASTEAAWSPLRFIDVTQEGSRAAEDSRLAKRLSAALRGT